MEFMEFMELREKAIEIIDYYIDEMLRLMSMGCFYSIKSSYEQVKGLINAYYQIDLISKTEFQRYSDLAFDVFTDISVALLKVHFVI